MENRNLACLSVADVRTSHSQQRENSWYREFITNKHALDNLSWNFTEVIINATMSFLKIWLLSVNFEKFTNRRHLRCINHSRPITRLRLVALVIYRSEFLKGNGQQPNFQEWHCSIHYQLCNISTQIIECKMFAPYQLTIITILSMLWMWSNHACHRHTLTTTRLFIVKAVYYYHTFFSSFSF